MQQQALHELLQLQVRQQQQQQQEEQQKTCSSGRLCL
jgi:hypothetical protein